MPNYLICICGSHLFSIVNKDNIICYNCFKEWSLTNLENLNSENQKKSSEEEKEIWNL